LTFTAYRTVLLGVLGLAACSVWLLRGRGGGKSIFAFRLALCIAGGVSLVFLRDGADVLRLKGPAVWSVALAIFLLGLAAVTQRRWNAWSNGFPASPRQLGYARAVICGALLLLAVKDPLSSVLYLPAETFRTTRYLFGQHLGWFATLARSPTFLLTLEYATPFFLALGALGLFTTITLPLSAVAYTLYYAVLVGHIKIFHTGLLPLLLLFVLLFLPAGDRFSLDAVWRVRRGQPPKRRSDGTYAGSILLLLLVYVAGYAAAGLSKLHSDPFWVNGSSLRYLMLADSLTLIDYDSNCVARLVSAGIGVWPFTIAAALGIATELSLVLLIVDRRARYFVPVAIVLLHVGIFLGQEFTFWDLLLLPLAFVRVRSGLDDPGGKPSEISSWRCQPAFPVLAAAIIAVASSGWLLRIEKFPFFTTWGMYDWVRARPVVPYERLYGVLATGERVRTDLTSVVPVLSNSLWRTILPSDKRQEKRTRRLLVALGHRHNEQVPSADRFVALDLERWQWDTLKEPRSDSYGQLVRRIHAPLE
jgi:hypothetical protein